MTIEAKIIADSISPSGHRLTTFQLRYPRFIHAELMTHRVFSRNASSSRAIPVARMIEDLRRDPAMPVYWGSNKPGMQAGEELSEFDIQMAKAFWIEVRNYAIQKAEQLIGLGLHKQIANRILEPWAHINVVLTATDYENFWTLRRHKDAQPEIKALADAMWDAQQASEPNELHFGDWHLPYVSEEECNRLWRNPPKLPQNCDHPGIMVSVARCARVSYLTHDGRKTTLAEDLQLYDRLLGAQPLHASPAEHQATPDSEYYPSKLTDPRWEWKYAHQHGNFTGWRQYRKMLDGEFVAG